MGVGAPPLAIRAFFGGGGTKQLTPCWGSPVGKTNASPVPVMWTSTAPAWPLSLPIFLLVGVPPGACVYLIFVPLGNGPKIVPLPRSLTKTSTPVFEEIR